MILGNSRHGEEYCSVLLILAPLDSTVKWVKVWDTRRTVLEHCTQHELLLLGRRSDVEIRTELLDDVLDHGDGRRVDHLYIIKMEVYQRQAILQS